MTVAFRDVSFSYGEKQIFSSYSLTLDTSAVISGPSGSGKTALLKLVGGLIMPDSGSIDRFFQKPAFMFQEDRLLPWLTVRENIAVVSEGKATDTLLMETELDSLAEKNVSEISGGEKRRCALARALAFDGDVLLLDEPFKGLDEPLAAKMASLILRTGKPYIAVLHSSFEIGLMGKNADRVILPSHFPETPAKP